MRIAVRHRIRLVAQGNRSGLVGGAVTDNSGTQVIVSFRAYAKCARLTL